MIFVTVGNMDPFDRLIRAVDQWIDENPGRDEIFAQIGNGTYEPKGCKFVRFLDPNEYRQTFERARLIVSHAGMGTIITALELQKPILLMPKRASLGEQRNEHQLATVHHFTKSTLIQTVESEANFSAGLNAALKSQDQQTSTSATAASEWPADPKLIKFVRDFVLS